MSRAAAPSRTRHALVTLGLVLVGVVAGATLVPNGQGPSAASRPGRADVGFSQDMIVHHQQAVSMALSVRGRRLTPAVAAIASAIELNQQREIGQMQGWLSLWNAPTVSSGEPMDWMQDRSHRHGARPGAAMPGLASTTELDRLGRASGTEAETLFLQLMIRHHQGGVTMAQAAIKLAGQRQVSDLARVMSIEQQQEIAQMSGHLTRLGARPLPVSPHG